MLKKTLSRSLALLLALTLVLGLAPWALAADDGSGGDGQGTEAVGPSDPGDGKDEPSDPPEPPASPDTSKPVESTDPTPPMSPSIPPEPSPEPTGKPDPEPPAEAGVELDKSSLSLTVGDKATLRATTTPSGQPISWSSGSGSVATVKDGEVTAVGKGSTKITVSFRYEGQDYKATCDVTVAEKASTAPKFTLNKDSLSLEKGKTATLSVSAAPSSTAFSVSWSSSSTGTATVSSSGVVTGKAKGSATITATVTPKSGGKAVELKCSVSVTDPAPGVVSYSTGTGEAVVFTASDFNSVCSSYTGYNLSYVKFTLPSSSKGTLYYDYDTGSDDYDSKVDKSTKYYRSDTPALSKVAFLPASSTSGEVSISYTGYDTKGNSYSGTVKIDVSKNSGTISYDATAGEALVFDSSDFNDLCKKITGRTLDYVRFEQPGSSKGVLYFDYDDGSGKKIGSSTSYYYDDTPSLDKVAFVPAKDFDGTVNITFSGRSSKKDDFSGTVKVTVGKSTATVTYSIETGEVLTLDASDFNKLCKKETGRTLDYVKFTSLPAKSKGVLYYDYNTSNGSYDKVVSKSTSYYYDDKPGLGKITFVPDSRGTVSIDFTGRDTNNKTFSGVLKITVGGESGDISYSVLAGSAVDFKVSDFNSYCKEETGSNLDYVKFTPPSSKGTLYYKYDQSGEKKVTSSLQYVRSGSPNVDDLSFVASGSASGTVSIPFTGRSTSNKSFSGTVVVKIASAKSPSVVRYSTGVEPVVFQSSDFQAACLARGGNIQLASVQFPTLPDKRSGRLYTNYGGPSSFGGHVNTGTKYGPSGTNSLGNISFVPHAGFKGVLAIPYTGTDTAGNTYTGSVEITVAPPDRSRHFRDTERYAWAVPSVDYLYENQISKGVNDSDYGPDKLITRGDFVLMLVRAFQISAKGDGNFADVPADSYYYDAIAAAKALGVAQGKGDGDRFSPTDPLTRQDAMVLLQRTLQAANRDIESYGGGSLSRFKDADAVAEYARQAVELLVQAEVIQGDDSNQVNPRGNLSRAEMAVILHRVLTQ